MKRAEANDISRAVIDKTVYQAWVGWCDSETKALRWSHEQVATAKHIIELGLDECELLETRTFKNP